MKILVITDIPSPYKITFLEMMSKYHEIDVYFQDRKSDDRDDKWYKSTSGINARYLNQNKLRRFVDLLTLDISDYDIFWNLKYVAWESMLMAVKFRLKHKLNLMHADGGIYHDFGVLLNFGMRRAMALNHYFTSSGILTNEYYLKNGVSKDKIFHYHFSSVCQKDIEFAPINKSNDSNTVFNLLSVGQPIHRKGFDVLLKAIADITNVKLTIVGGEPNQECSELLNSLTLKNKVNFVPFVPFEQLKEYYLNSDLFVFPTREDIWGLVLNEAMIFGLPIISTTNCGAAVEFAYQYKNCICVDVDNSEMLKNQILEVLTNDQLRLEMAANSRKFANEVVIDRMVYDYNEIFEDLESKIKSCS